MVVRKQPLGAASLRNGEHTLLLVLHRNALGDRRDTMADTRVQLSAAELPDGPVLKCLWHVCVGYHREDRRMLRTECEDGHALRAAPDVVAERI